MKPVYGLLLLAAMCHVSSNTLTGDNKTEKTWSFQGRDGEVDIKVIHFVDNKGPTSLNLYSPNGTTRSVVEEAGFLASVLENLPKEGIDVRSLDLISLRLQEKDAISRVAIHAALSKAWRVTVKTKEVSVVYPLVTTLLNDSGAYKEWDSVFRLHGLNLRVAGVENVIMEPFSQVQTNCPPGANCKDLLVPRDALIEMNISPNSRTR